MITTEVRPFIITRTFNAPRKMMWSLWTEQQHMSKWFGPKGATIGKFDLDLRVGGMFHYMLQMEGMQMWGKAVYKEIVPPEKIVWINSFSDAEGGITRHPLTTDPWPLELLTEVTFEEADGKTTIRIEWTPVNATDAEVEFFNLSHASMQQGWTGTFDRLEVYLPGLH